jgi:hypothetical protein
MSTANLLNSNFDEESDEEDFNPQPQDASDGEDGGDVEDPSAQIQGEAAKRRAEEDNVSGDEDEPNTRAPNDDEEEEEQAGDDDEEDEEDDEEDEIAVRTLSSRTTALRVIPLKHVFCVAQLQQYEANFVRALKGNESSETDAICFLMSKPK